MALKFSHDELIEIGSRIQDARIAKHMTQATVAELCGCTAKHISDIERGAVGPSFPLIAKMGELFDTGVDFFLRNIPNYRSNRMVNADISGVLADCEMETRMYSLELIKMAKAFEKRLTKKHDE